MGNRVSRTSNRITRQAKNTLCALTCKTCHQEYDDRGLVMSCPFLREKQEEGYIQEKKGRS